MILDRLVAMSLTPKAKPEYAVCRIRCACGRLVLHTLSSGEVYCKACGRTISAVPESDVYGSLDELLSDLGSGPVSDCSDILRDRISGLEKDLADKEAELTEACGMIEEYRNRIRELEAGIRDRTRAETEAGDLRKENSELRESMDSAVKALRSEAEMFKKANVRLSREKEEVEDTNRHLSSEMARIGRFDLRDIVGVLMEYAATVNNIAADSDDPEHIRTMISARTEQMAMKLGGEGVEVEHHSRGEPLGDGRIDITETSTGDEAADMTVARINRYGCRFRDDAFPAIVENVVVNRFRQETKEDKE